MEYGVTVMFTVSTNLVSASINYVFVIDITQMLLRNREGLNAWNLVTPLKSVQNKMYSLMQFIALP